MKDLNVNECIEDIYYINDMFILKREAIEHKDKLREIILKEKYNNDKALMDSIVNVELLYNYSAKEKFGDTFIAKIFDIMEANSQISSFYNESPWFLISLAMDYLEGRVARIAIKHGPEKVKKALEKILIRKFKLNMKDAGYAADFLLGEALEKSTEEFLAEIARYDIDEVLDTDLDEMREKIEHSMLEGKDPIIVTFGQGNLFYKAVRQELSGDYHVSVLAKFLRHINIGQLGSDSLQPSVRVFLDNDKPTSDFTLISSLNPTHVNPVRYIITDFLSNSIKTDVNLYKTKKHKRIS